MRHRFFVELALASGAGCLLLLTAAWNDWIERVFHVDPDAGSGSVEWSLAAAAVAFVIGFTMLAAAEFRHSRWAGTE